MAGVKNEEGVSVIVGTLLLILITVIAAFIVIILFPSLTLVLPQNAGIK